MTIKSIVKTIFERKRQSAIFEHQFIRVQEIGTDNIFDVQFYNSKIQIIEKVEIKVGDEVEIDTNVNGRFWEKGGKEGVFIKINGQNIKKL